MLQRINGGAKMTLTIPSRHEPFWPLTRHSEEYARNRFSLESVARKTLPQCQPVARQPVSKKWFKEPKIPIHMNMSTLIRMKNNESKGEETADEGADHRTSEGCGPKGRRMFDYMREKLEAVEKGDLCNSPYSKNFFWKVVSVGESEISVSANPSGDGLLKSGTYHRVSAISVNDRRSGCNMQFVEKVSFESAPKVIVARESRANGEGNSDQMGNAGGIQEFGDLRITAANKVCQKGDGRADNRVEIRRKKIKKHKRSVVVTSLRSSVKYVRKSQKACYDALS